MLWIIQPISRVAVRLLPAAMVIGAGCHQFPDVFVDELPDSSMVKTMSSEYARRAEATIAPRTRDFEPIRIEPQDGTVAHGPLWFADPLEMTGSDDGRFAVTVEEFAYFLPGAARWLANIALLPISMVKDPADVVMCSNGRQRRSRECGAPEPYDAEPCHGATLPPDIDDVWTFDEMVDSQFAPSQEDEPASEDADTGPGASEGQPQDGDQ